jgi:hypothetical protein
VISEAAFASFAAAAVAALCLVEAKLPIELVADLSRLVAGTRLLDVAFVVEEVVEVEEEDELLEFIPID